MASGRQPGQFMHRYDSESAPVCPSAAVVTPTNCVEPKLAVQYLLYDEKLNYQIKCFLLTQSIIAITFKI